MALFDVLDDFLENDEEPYDVNVVTGENINIDDRVDLMIDQVLDSRSDKRVYQILGQILKGVPERDWDGEVSAIFNWVKKNIRYTRDPLDVELFRSARASYRDRIGDCDDMSIMLAALLRAAGYVCKFRVIGLTEGVYEHVYVVCGIPPEEPERWVALDPSQPQGPGWEVEKSKIKEILDYMIEEEEEDGDI